MKTKIILVDDHKLFREGIKRIVEFEDDLEVIAEGANGEDAISLVEMHSPDVILMDINMPIINGIEATQQLISQNPNLKIIILSIHDDESYVQRVLNVGAVGYLLKEMDADTLIEAIRVVATGGAYLHPKVTSKLITEFRRLSISDSVNKHRDLEPCMPLHLLTKRECEVLQLLANGKSNRVIGDDLYISEKTVKNHVSSILQKMDVNDRTHAVVEAIRKGWVQIV